MEMFGFVVRRWRMMILVMCRVRLVVLVVLLVTLLVMLLVMLLLTWGWRVVMLRRWFLVVPEVLGWWRIMLTMRRRFRVLRRRADWDDVGRSGLVFSLDKVLDDFRGRLRLCA